ncbi:transposase [Streptomyces sp. NBC_01092]|uniref:transposase n=1 Tax=Streptomyces sp. NBC_01092 TaxID=2903748 RepID=UPI003864832F
MTPLRRQLGTFARRQPGCAALLQHYGIGTVTAVAIWAELGDARRFSSSRQAVRHAGLEVTVYSSDNKRAPAASPGRVHHCCAGRCSKRPNARPGPAPPTTPTTSRSRLGAAATGPRCRWPANSCAGPPARTGGGRHSPRPDVSRRPPAASCRLTASKDRGAPPREPDPLDQHVARPTPQVSAHRDKAGPATHHTVHHPAHPDLTQPLQTDIGATLSHPKQLPGRICVDSRCTPRFSVLRVLTPGRRSAATEIKSRSARCRRSRIRVGEYRAAAGWGLRRWSEGRPSGWCLGGGDGSRGQ